MSKISEQKALEIYPDIEINWTMTDRTKERMIYADGYDQAMQDVLEKAEEFFNKELFTRFSGEEHRVASNKCMNLQQFIEQFKNYIKNES